MGNQSETSTARERLAQFCSDAGYNGLDIGAGGDPILPHAICIDRAIDDLGRAHTGADLPANLIGDAAKLYWFTDNSLDWVYSSHTLEDFEDTAATLAEWLRVIRPGGHLVLFLPDQATYVDCCSATNSLPNQAHKHADFSLEYVKKALITLGYGDSDVVHEMWPVPHNAYSFDLVVRKK